MCYPCLRTGVTHLSGLYTGVRGLLTPYSEMTFDGSSKSYRLGMRWELDALFDLNLTGERRESNSSAADHAIMLKGDIRF